MAFGNSILLGVELFVSGPDRGDKTNRYNANRSALDRILVMSQHTSANQILESIGLFSGDNIELEYTINDGIFSSFNCVIIEKTLPEPVLVRMVRRNI